MKEADAFRVKLDNFDFKEESFKDLLCVMAYGHNSLTVPNLTANKEMLKIINQKVKDHFKIEKNIHTLRHSLPVFIENIAQTFYPKYRLEWTCWLDTSFETPVPKSKLSFLIRLSTSQFMGGYQDLVLELTRKGIKVLN
jgi:hypothetical protein